MKGINDNLFNILSITILEFQLLFTLKTRVTLLNGLLLWCMIQQLLLICKCQFSYFVVTLILLRKYLKKFINALILKLVLDLIC
jgi:hypothetical protein